MLTVKHILKAARLMHFYGELRPGYLDHQASNLEGPVRSKADRGTGAGSSSKSDERVVELTLSMERSEATGELRFVRK